MYQKRDDLIKSCVELHDAYSVLEQEIFEDDDFRDAGIRYVNGKWQAFVFRDVFEDEQ